ncbi:competence type IV pilus minor pilin ComGF [Bacillus sp. FJAT-50079]|uniref:competence type IV pilus minor pilin ComGF n=1 Tax=Bacillus sp. FJAT-50079 TaxID=2833577 RepID=UPI001BC9D918|nr:competence type IV pilus minor pilin ComGF [Bacillus sp. FJAT-50079]MBS4209612.1 prepilin-type N-terminal cleavage/methylation domain-containing protein [Bacillus sp. FJAT-50079]
MKESKNVWNSQLGFTLLEMTLSILILTMIMLIIPLVFSAFTALDRSLDVADDYEWNLFLIQFRQEVEMGDQLTIGKERMFIDIRHTFVEYEVYQDVIRRKNHGLGHEVVLQQLKNAHFSKQDDFLILSVEFLNGTKDETRIPIKK